MDNETLKALLGVALVGGFVILIVICVILDKTANKRFKKKIDGKYKIREKFGDLRVTEDDQLMWYLKSGTLDGYKIWDLKDIAYMGISNMRLKSQGYTYSISLLDGNKKALKGKYLTPSRKPLLQHKQTSFAVRDENVQKAVFEFLKKYNPGISLIANGEVIDG